MAAFRCSLRSLQRLLSTICDNPANQLRPEASASVVCASRIRAIPSRNAVTPLLRCATMRPTGTDGMMSPASPCV
ncbi:hypothetical protein DRV60_22335 [Salmonella enterica subsp. enterica]|nr:hypothetical protein [Salmonella enterica subsp. enterica serovar Pomona]